MNLNSKVFLVGFGLLAWANTASANNIDLLNRLDENVTGLNNDLHIVQEHISGLTQGANIIVLTIDGNDNGGHGQRWRASGMSRSSLRPGSIVQIGADNHIAAFVRGDGNLFAFAQRGQGNRIAARMVGHSNQASVAQAGFGNVASFSQTGSSNSVVISQATW